MKPPLMFRDNQQTFELKTYEVTLTCGGCGEGIFLPVENAPEVDALHACTGCGRELAVEGLPYPCAKVKRVLASEQIIETPVPVDPNAPPEKLTPYEISFLYPDAQMAIMRETLDVEVVDVIRMGKEAYLHTGLQLSMREGLYQMARELVALRALESEPADYDENTQAVNQGIITAMAQQLLTTRRVEVIDFIWSAVTHA